MNQRDQFGLVAGGALVLLGLRFARLPSLLLMAGGGLLIDRAVRGERSWLERGLAAGENALEEADVQDDDDLIDEASRESFPASDPPSFHASR